MSNVVRLIPGNGRDFKGCGWIILGIIAFWLGIIYLVYLAVMRTIG